MKIEQIVFTAKNTAELLDREIKEPGENEVLVEMAYTTISAGTEKANLTGDLNINAAEKLKDTTPHFPRYLGYSGAGTVVKIGPGVTKVKAGDRVVAAFGTHSSKVHYPGITLVGAHTNARPERESYPNYWAYPDEIDAIFKLAAGGQN